MKVFILCGGFGTRLAGVGGDLPKPMVQLGGKPIVWRSEERRVGKECRL